MIEIKNVSKTYHNKTKDFLALKDINLTFDNTGIVFIYGESGNGKSTLLNIISGLDSYDGKIMVDGVDLGKLTPKQMEAYRRNHIGYIFEDYNLIENLTIKENLKIAAHMRGNELTNEEISDLLKALNLEGVESRMPCELSSGQKQRVSIARTVFEKPRVLFVDEPTGHLDYNSTNLIWNILKEISKQCLVIAVSHEKRIVEEFGDRIVELRNGEVVSDETKVEASATSSKKGTAKPKTKFVKTASLKPKIITSEPIKIDESNKLNAKAVAKISFSNLFIRKFRSIMLIILSSISLLFFSTFFLLNSYNQNFVLAKTALQQDLNYVSFENTQQITNKSMLNLYENVNGVELFNVRNANLNFAFGSAFKNSNDKDFKIDGLIELSSVLTNGENALGQKVVKGEYPNASNSNAIVISDYTARLMMKYGVRAKVGNIESVLNPSSYEELVGKNVLTNGVYMPICGIYETNYNQFFTNDLVLKKGVNKAQANYYANNIYNKVHINGEFINTLKKNVNAVSNVLVSAKTNLLISGNEIFNASNGTFEVTCDIDKFTTNGKASLNSLEINLPVATYNYLFNQNVSSDLSNLDLTLNDNNFIEIAFNNDLTVKYTVVGVNNTEDTIIMNSNDFSKGVRTSNGFALSVINSTLYPCFNVVASTASANNLGNLIETMNKLQFSLETFNANDIVDFSNKLEVFKDALLAISIVTALFSAVFMFMFVAQVIEDRQHDIGILIALGASRWDILKIFGFTAFMVSITCFILSSIFTLLISSILNMVVFTNLTFNIFSLNIMTFVWLFIVSVGVAIASSIVPILRSVRKTPIDVLKEQHKF